MIIPPRRVAAVNRAAWDEIAPHQDRRPGQRAVIADLRRGRTTLWPAERELMGPVRGRRLLHLQCGAGEDTLAWALLGARATGVDIAPARIASAKRNAALTGLKAGFVAADVARLPFRRHTFDLAYTSRGAMVWLGELDGWAREVARVLRPGGRFLVCDEHPVLNCLFQRGRRVPQIGWDYFDQRPRGVRGWGFLPRGGPSSPKAETAWKLSDVFNALAGAGLTFVTSRESHVPTGLAFWMPPARRRILPQTLLSVWRKPSARAR